MGDYDWRLSEKNVWKVERMLLDTKHQPLRMPEARFRDFRRRYRAFKAAASRPQTAVLRRTREMDADPREFLGNVPRRHVSLKGRPLA